MKRLTLTAFAAFICFLFSCKNNSANETGNGQSNASMYKEANAKIYKAIETGDVSALDSILATDAIDHGDPSGHDVVGKDSIKASLAQVHNMFSNIKFEVMNSATDNDVTLERVRMTGTCNMDMPEMGMMKGKNIDMTSVEVTKYKDGKAYEHWTFLDQQDVKKMGPPPPPAKEK